MTKQERFFALKISSIMATRLFGLFMIFPVFSVYAVQYENTTPYLIGLAIGIYGLTQALLQIPFGYLSDQFGRKPLLVVGLVFFFIGSVVAANSTDIIHVVIGRALQGSGAISAVLMAFLADFVAEDQRSKANAFVGMQIGLAFMLSLLIGPLITINLGISGLFWVIAGLSIVALIIVTTLPYVKPHAQYSLSIPNIKQVLTAKLLKLDFSIFTLHLILTCTFIVMPVLLVENNIVATDLKDNWSIYLPVMLLSFVGMLPIIILAEKFKKHKIMILTAITIMAVSQILFYQTTLTYTTFLVLLTLFFIAFNAMEAMLPSLISKIATKDKRGLAMGLYSTSQFLGAFVGGVFGGWIYNIYDLNSVFLLTTLMAIIWLGVMLTMKQQKTL
ncbi:Major facilitator family transporter [uncultured Gammaproteobacteria bacterium]|jgi:MFS family permease|uniref:MFS transporter n=1 Tax=thiotrophic endosymbiont of Bathymodiolus puteoserpentis (Logatchev) TaxID=343240 RepID=UPI0010BC3428|nr:MFS transporter [thiotrophic endosymbiont of Bathymodiolus puteoserpentis (Logatchev)]CAC9589307.1 Inner membrane transport protein YajR [uncultured Gammaproteobacteria bacterium]CAC9590868.1 Inner membrane transport protein YajR [uncultured Gammaproteobacteria bacterium]CAC9627922.1 Inner membrane transport protein YajR [uncultured Gammaproteobacteria bacterium]CAC9652613.1 Inner membrane transport protein YajR [uncultured Gammaproteobacteria bacterium]SSC09892.1 Major facilitator family t